MKYFFINLKVWWYKQTHFEFFGKTKKYLPISIFAFYQALKIQSFNWISYINPTIYKSGLFGHSKNYLLNQLPQEVILKSVFIKKKTLVSVVIKMIHNKELTFPLVVKPDCLYNGIGIQKIENIKELTKKYDGNYDLLIQEFASYKKEYALFYIRFPEDTNGKIISLIEKEFMQFVGNGILTLAEIINNHPRGWLYIKKLTEIYSEKKLQSIPKHNEIILAGFIGSHHRGVLFHNKLSKITKKMSQTFDTLTKNIPEFYYGRYDIMADSILEIEHGNFEILELNGALGEPVHVYDSKTTIREGYSVLFEYWSIMKKIARQNMKRGIKTAKKPD
jgi:hypothetical protein